MTDRRGISGDTPRAYTSRAAWALMLITLVVGLTADLGSKWWAFRSVAETPVVLDREQLTGDPEYNPVPHHDALATVPGVLQFRLCINRGAVFGVGANQRAFFILFTLVALVGGLYVFRRMTAADAYHAHIAVGLVFAGGIGNLYDRVQFAAVRDFIQLFPGYRLPAGWTWPGNNPEMFPWVFNIADVMLLVGMLTLMSYLGRQRRAARAVALGVDQPA